MPVMRPCLDCGTLVPIPGQRCQVHERRHADWLLGVEPWRRVYSNRRWKTTAREVCRRDDFRCTYAVNGRRCANTNLTGMISVHHLTKLRLLWARHGEPRPDGDRWDDFLDAAYDPSNLVTLCSRHHHLADTVLVGAPDRKARAKRRTVQQHYKRQRAKLDKIAAAKAYTRDKRKDWE